MNKRLQAILDLLQQSESLTPEEKKSLADAVKESDKEITITEFKLERTEKVKRTTAILLEETIAELELKRKSVEAQNRELEIEAALERVRSSAMAMHNSNDISATTSIVFTELQKLGTQSKRCGVGLLSKDSHMAQVYAATTSDGEFHTLMRTISMTEHSSLAQQYETWLKQENYQTVLKGEDLKSYYNLPFFHSSASYTPPEHYDQKEYGYYFPFPEGLFYAWTETLYSESELNILNRFKTIIALTFRRYLDLKKAEAQAREAQIEAALERVRSRSMGMQKSEELKEVIQVVYDQFVHLNILIGHTGFIMDYKTRDDMHIWLADQHEVPSQVTIPYFDSPHWNSFNEAKEKGKNFFANKLTFEEKNRFYQTLFEFVPGLTEESKEYYFSCPGLAISTVLLDNVGLYIENFSGIPYSDEENATLIRFGKVFQQTYTRFLDLQKAEAQAREAKIENALEKVRSRSLAMHKSDELQQVVNTVFERLKELNIHPDSSNIAIFKQGSRDFDYWIASPSQERTASFHLPYIDKLLTKDLIAARESGAEYFVRTYTFEEKNEWFGYAFKNTDFKLLSEDRKQFILDAPAITVAIAFSKQTGIQINIYAAKLVSEGEIEILKRFSKVFEQAYIRFLDLQKAEAQAREALIEAALEKVRSRTLAMHTAHELGEVVLVIVEKLKELGVVLDANGVILCTYFQNSKNVLHWIASPDSSIAGSYLLPYFDHPIFKDAWESKMSGADYFSKSFSVEQKNSFFEYAFEHSDYKYFPDEFKQWVFQNDKHSLSFAWQKNSAILIPSHTGVVPGEGDKEILKRFSKVFEQAYIRFLDLQKAEAQAKEAKIEAGLERVRSRAMAMQTSEELNALIGTVFTELTKLDLVLTRCVIMTFDHKTKDARWWMANSEAPEQPMNFYVKYHEHPPNLAYFSAWAERTVKWIYTLEGKVKKEWDDFIFSETELRLLPDFVIAGMKAPERVYLNASFYNSGNLTLASLEPLSDEHFDILIRFAKVFDLTYTRFNDLKQAEAQAREAKIEAALERVRSRTMAMQRSEELVDVASVLFQQVKALGVPQWNCGFNIWEVGDKEFTYYPGSPDGKILPTPCKIPLTEHPVFISFDESRKRGDELFIYEKEGEYQAEHYRYMLSLPGVGNLLHNMLDAGFQLPTFQIDHVANFAYGNLIFITYEHFPDMHDVFKRFAKVFEQTYTRFLDLQQAEGQAREAQIQLALERVRARTMAMQHSNELRDAASVLFQQVKELGIEAWTCGFSIWDEDRKAPTAWLSRGVMQPPFKTPLTENQTLMHFYEAAQRGESLFVEEVSGETLTELYRYLGTLLVAEGISDEVRKPGYAPPTFQVNHVAYFSYGYLLFITYHQYPEAHDIFKRFAKVFEQTYTRFLDLQRAEAQARESQIEASLERVRSKTMAMHNSQDVGDTVATVFDELLKLNIKTNRCGILIFSNSADTEAWTAKSAESGKATLIIGHLDVTRHPMLTSARNAWENKEASFSYELIGDDLTNYYQMINNQPDYPIRFDMDSLPSKEIHTEFYFPDGAVFAFTSEPIAADDTQIFKRLASVFGQTYRRYLDLQKAEAQAREAQIEAALERVRSRTMAMHRSEEIADIVGKILKELISLDVALNRVLIWIFNADEKYFTWWSANPEAESNAEGHRVDYFEHPVFLTYYEAWQKRLPLLLYTLGDDLKVSFEDHLFKNTELSRLPKAVQDGMRSEKKIFTTSAIGDYGLLMAGCFEPFSDEINDIIQRFGRVFQQSYTRYVDVQKAEAQTREATIEASLEKVRGKAMAMHNSNDLSVTASMVFTELRKLGINPFRCGVSLQTKESRKNLLYYSIPSAEGDTLSLAGSALLSGHPVLSAIYDNWVRGEDYFPVLKGESLINYYETLKQVGFDVPVSPSGHEQYGYYLAFSEGVFYGWSEKSYTDDELKILHRFKVIIDLTFRRYMELQKSEENAKEAIRQASLDRVRAEIASMRTTNDLDRITPLIWKELNILSMPFVRCGVFIMDEVQRQMHTFLSTPEGDAIAAFNLPYETPGNVGEILSHWLNKQVYISHWDEMAFSELGELLLQQGAIPSKEVYMSTVPPGGIHLHCLPFLQGMLYVGNTTQLKEDDIHLIQSVADAFSTAYARYEDFNKLESAKVQIEKTLTDLKQTQNLLVQSEKMASLGELTAGIAHEIQNPLNFVNNFSEVSNELLEEMKEEIEKGNLEEVQTITNNIRQNLEKILHHGKRADAIVKGMLQHSRSSSGVKEPTDINALADEYLRLAYHGFRAKDKSFNAATTTDLDKSIGKVNVVPQDIGRVVLNLITNAFYAVTEKQKTTAAEYQPTVFLTTKRSDDCVLISVKDNGNGIPEQIREKIFQPFFTTKPTGQGTGLGLSLSYDIVKAHGGELKMHTTPGEGSEFVISILDK